MVVSFQALGAWVKESFEILVKSNQDISVTFSDPVLSRLMGYVWDLWENSFEGVAHQIREIFDTTVKIYRKLDDLSPPMTGDSWRVGRRCYALTKFLVECPWHCKYKFWALATLLAGGVSPDIFTSINPDFFLELLQLIG